MSIILPQLPNFIAVPDYPPHCSYCGLRAMLISDFYHTNYKGGIYECRDCREESTYFFIDQEDEMFSIDYWQMSQKDRRSYQKLTEEQVKVFLRMNDQEKEVFLSMKSKERGLYITEKEKELYIYFDIPEDYYNSLTN